MAEHRGQPPADAAPVELVLLLGCESGEDLLALAVAEHSEVEFVVVAAEVGELGLLGRPEGRLFSASMSGAALPRACASHCAAQVRKSNSICTPSPSSTSK
jgi:hypothetical protein